VDEIYHQALKLLRRRDHSVAQLREKLSQRYGEVPDELIETLRNKRFLDDARFAGNLVVKRRDCDPSLVREELRHAGIPAEIAEQALAAGDWSSLQDVLRAKMAHWKLHAPIQPKEAARLFRALARLGYPEDNIREELDQLHEQ
jgi:SOS response regulatory protein OraA/RecX